MQGYIIFKLIDQFLNYFLFLIGWHMLQDEREKLADSVLRGKGRMQKDSCQLLPYSCILIIKQDYYSIMQHCNFYISDFYQRREVKSLSGAAILIAILAPHWPLNCTSETMVRSWVMVSHSPQFSYAHGGGLRLLFLVSTLFDPQFIFC